MTPDDKAIKEYLKNRADAYRHEKTGLYRQELVQLHHKIYTSYRAASDAFCEHDRPVFLNMLSEIDRLLDDLPQRKQ